ncbi:UNKNOWN [Stylonychia lemnae]|uniref:Uncharacterized protein n=1 Tax=Stylonychia lemnae TaxID=5949 RepID=A0A078AEH1_STYLE|nr:UNKNOWN [Stylonychia lemnae]|eukprot:CDW79313.1 UNKNOWN [Stylonychia lemnae]
MLQLTDDILICGKEQNQYTFAFGDWKNGIAICKLIQKGNYDYQLIQEQQRLIEKGYVRSIVLVTSNTIAYSDNDDHCLKIFDIEQRKQIHQIKLAKHPHIFVVQDYDYELNPFAFVKDNEKISLINLRNYQIVKVIDSKYNHFLSWNKNGSLINERIKKEEAGSIYRLIDVQRDNTSVEIREIIVKLP